MDDIERLQEAIGSAKRIVAFTGAGISTESGTPERWCRPSTFWVMMAVMRPCSTSLASARWPALGSALSMVSSVANLRRQDSRRISSDAMKSSK